MRLNDEILEYICGRKYTNALPVRFHLEDEDRRYATQIELLCELAYQKKVIHVGCVDHNIETVLHKIQRKKWLHGRLCECANRCHGVDITEEPVRYIRDTLGYRDTSCADIFSDEFARTATQDTWDYLMIPEVLEHLGDPVAFLRAVAQKFGKVFSKIILTVPNGISQDNWKLAKKGIEVINSDHCYWFSPYTLAKTVISAGWDVEKILMCRHGTINRRSVVKNHFYKKHPLLRNDILCIASFRHDK